MRWRTATIAAAWLVGATTGSAQEQVLQAKATFVFNGEQVRISRDSRQAEKFVAAFAGSSDDCGEPCIAPMQVANGVVTFGETEVLQFLVNEVAGNTGLMVDARMPQDRERGFIPGSVSLPHETMAKGNPFKIDILKALGAREFDGTFNFADARALLVYDRGPSSSEAGKLVNNLLEAGYPAAKIKYYRGGMQVWSVLGFSIEEGAS